MSTSRCPTDPGCTADLGAQYISATPEYMIKHKAIYDDLLHTSLLKPLACKMEGARSYPEGTQHFVTPKGVSSIVRHFIDQAQDVTVEKDQLLESLIIKDGKWEAISRQGRTESFDCVILTMPVPQVLQIKGSVQALISSQDNLLNKLRDVEYSSRFAVGLFYQKDAVINISWDVKYFFDDPCIRYVSVDNRKRQSNDCPSIVVHTSVPFGFAHLEEDNDAVCDIIMKYLHPLVPNLPDPTFTKCQKWRYSQVHKPYIECPGCMMVNDSPRLLLAGDAFTHSNFDGCIESAMSVTKILTSKM